MLEVPREFAVVWIDRNRGTGVQCVAFGAARQRHPGFGLSRSPVRQIEDGIIAARDPHLAAGAIAVRKVSPGVAPLVPRRRDRVEPPQLLAGIRVVGAEKTFFFLVATAAAQSLDHFSIHNERSARVAVALPDLRTPGTLAVARVERDDAVAAGEVDLVLIKRDAAHGDIAAEPVFPNDFAGRALERLHDAAGVCEIENSVMYDRC